MKYSNRHISDDELDQLFRDAHASEGPEPLYVPEFWSEMEALLPQQQQKKRGFYWIPLAAAVILFSTLLFYPPSATEIAKVKQHAANEETTNSDKDQAAPVTENNSGQTTAQVNEEIPAATSDFQTGQRVRAPFNTPRRITPNNDPAFRVVHIDPPVPGVVGSTPVEEPVEDAVSATIPVPESVEHADDAFSLEPRTEKIIHDEVAGLPKKTPRESNQWYVELGPTLGQSPYMSEVNKRNASVGAVLGGGYTKRVDQTSVTLGLQARLEGFGGLTYRESNFSQNIVRTVSVKQLYSLEMPLKFGYHFRRSEFAFSVVPGVQLFIHGKERITQNQVVKREESYTGKVEHSNSLTMEFGLQYYYNLSSKYSIGAKFNADILRPFHTDYYLGKLSGFPVNGQLVLRRTFTK